MGVLGNIAVPWRERAFCDDDHPTQTSESQISTEATVAETFDPYDQTSPQCLPLTKISLSRAHHVNYLRKGLQQLSHHFTALDASRPWLCYWILHSLYLLGEDLDSETIARGITTLAACQHPGGGFGGGNGQIAHLATTYAAVNALVILGTTEAYRVIDREKLYRWLLRLKQSDGSFVMHEGGEVDVRGCYCAMSIAALLNLLTPELSSGTAEYISQCQTYEGGVGAVPGVEAHGGYTFCALAALQILNAGHLLDVPKLLRWSSRQQMSMEGGFRGRTNKLVDGCYSFWMGGIFPLIHAELSEVESDNWMDLYDREALQEYLLVACQPDGKRGGMRDKPGKNPDYYHTCYCLSGLSSAQHHVIADPIKNTVPNGLGSLCWSDDAEGAVVVGRAGNLLRSIHPIHNVGIDLVRRVMRYTHGESVVECILRQLGYEVIAEEGGQ